MPAAVGACLGARARSGSGSCARRRQDGAATFSATGRTGEDRLALAVGRHEADAAARSTPAGPSGRAATPADRASRRRRACAGRRPPRRPRPSRSRACRRARRSRRGRPSSSTSSNATLGLRPSCSSSAGCSPSSQRRARRADDVGRRAADHRLDERAPVEVLGRRPAAATEPSRSTCTRSEIACTSSSRCVM